MQRSDGQEGESALLRIAAHLEDALWLVDVPGERLIYVSPGFESVWGRSREDLLQGAEAFYATIHPEDRERVRNSAEGSLETGFEEEFRIALPDGGLRWVRHRSVPVWGERGEVAFTAGITQDIDERKRTESELRAMEIRFRVLVDRAFEVISEIDARGELVWSSSSQFTMFRHLEGSGLEERITMIHPEDRERATAHFASGFSRGQRTSTDYRVRDPQGGWRWFETLMTPYKLASGEQRMLMTSRDVTGNRELVERLRASEERFRLLAENAHELISEHDVEGRLLYANRRALELSGQDLAEFASRSPLDYVHPDDASHVASAYERLLRQGGRVALTFRSRHAGPDWRWIESNAHVHRTADGRRRIVTLSRDVTDRVRAQARVRESEGRYRQLVEQSPEAIAVICEGQILYANLAGAELAGVASATELLGRSLLDFVDSKSHDEVASWLAEGEDGGASSDLSFRVLRVDGELREVMGSGSKIAYAGTPALQVVLRDITQWKRAEREQQRLQLQLQEARKLESLGVLAGGIAHDFNNLLAVILGNVRFALRQSHEIEDARAALSDAVDAGESAARLTRQLLAYAGRRAPEVRSVDLSLHARSVIHVLEAAVPKKTRIELDLAGRLPCAKADVVQLEQVMMNLVLNAADAIGEEAGVVRLATGRICANREDLRSWVGGENLSPGEYVYVEVSDTGRGMDPDTLPRIFDPFFTTKRTGHGLGLSAVLGLVRGHGGGIALESEVGSGTTIRIHLPTSDERLVDDVEVPAPAPSLSATILVADDEPGVLRMLRRTLEARGCRVLEASDGVAALECFLAHSAEVDLVLLDLNMPHAGGEEVMGRLRSLRPDLPVLLASGYDEPRLASRTAGDSRFGFVNKPFDEDELLGRILSLLGAASAPRARAGG